MIIQLSFFLVIMREDDDAHDSMECVLNGGDWVVNHIVTPLVCDVALFVGVGVIFDYPWKNPLCD
jgi:hypothetical protein